MKCYRFCYVGFKDKCLTFSYDDGVIQDIEFIKRIKDSGFKVTFNLNSNLFGEIKFREGIDNSRIKKEYIHDLYQDFEVASHSLNHLHMENISYEDNYLEIKNDVNNLSAIFQRDIKGFAYPYGKYSDDTLKALKDNNMLYARTTKSTYDFSLPEDLLLWHPTIHHRDEKIWDVIDKFLSSTKELSLLYIWGHTYELENNKQWDYIDKFVDKLAHKDDIAYLTNEEIASYILALREVKEENNYLINHSTLPIYLKIDDKNICLLPQEKIEL